MSKVNNRHLKKFILDLNKVLAGENAYHRLNKDRKSIFESDTFMYYWEENHEWDGGHFNQVEYKVLYCVDEKKLLIEYKFWWKDKRKDYVFYRSVPINYLVYDKNELFQMVFPFTKRKEYPMMMETDFDFGMDSFCKQSAMEQELMEDINKDF